MQLGHSGYMGVDGLTPSEVAVLGGIDRLVNRYSVGNLVLFAVLEDCGD